MKSWLAAAGFLLALAGPAAAGEAPLWSVEPGSSVGFTAFQAGAPVDGLFKKFEAEIRFDPSRPETSRVAVVIDVSSVESGSQDRDDTIRSASLFDAATWPTARFVAERFTAAGGGRYLAHGLLTLRDTTREVVLPFMLRIEDHPDAPAMVLARASGELEVARLDYGVGQGLWTDTSVVADRVVIRIDILARRPGD